VNDPGNRKDPSMRIKARKAEAMHEVLVAVADRVLHAGPVKPRLPRAALQGMSIRAQKPPACAGPCLLEIGGKLQLGFAQLESHESRRGIDVIRHMLPWWEPVAEELEWLQEVIR
jgi:hypothetical protein